MTILLGWTSVSAAELRIATFNVSLFRPAAGQLLADLAGRENKQARQIAEILQRVRPDVVLLNEFDYEPTGEAVRRFHDHYLAVSQNGQRPLAYPHRFAPPVNTGVTPNTATHHPHDFNHDGITAHAVPPADASDRDRERYGADCFGFGTHPGQYGFVVYSRLPIRTDAIRTFQRFRWRDMPGAAIPRDWFTTADLEVFRLSSKNHCDVPIEIAPGVTFHLLASHPTPPVYDGPEDRNGRRNHDEIRLWADYLNNAGYLRDDAGRTGGLPPRARFVLLGDLNADPLDGDTYRNAIRQLLKHPRINSTFTPSSAGGTQQAKLQAGPNIRHRGNPAHDTGDFDDHANGPGNLRVDYVLPSKDGWAVVGGAVFWPASHDPAFPLVDASDHRLVYLDLRYTEER